MKIAFFDAKPYDKPSFEKYGQEKGIKFKYFETKLNEDTVELAKGFDGVCAFVNDTINDVVIDKLNEMGVNVLALRCAGFNNVDMKYAYGKLHVMRVPAYSPYAVAEHTMALLLTSIRRIHKAYIRSRDYNFSLANLTGFDLHGKTVGVIGTGRIGRVFIDICRGFGMRVIAYDKYENPALKDFVTYVSLDELLEKSDLISLHCPLFPETYHMINKDSIAKMKDTVTLVNTSRGGLINTEDLIDALRAKKFAAVGLDVYENEDELVFEDYSSDIIADETVPRLMAFPNVMITSHQAFFTREALQAIAAVPLENARNFNQGVDLGAAECKA